MWVCIRRTKHRLARTEHLNLTYVIEADQLTEEIRGCTLRKLFHILETNFLGRAKGLLETDSGRENLRPSK